ncbi:MAG: nitroreductase [Pseudomonadota bacterium]
MADRFPPPPRPTSQLAAARPSAAARRLLALRRSAGKQTLRDPGPTPSEVDELLRVAMRAPDHRRLEPWRFIVIEGEARAAFGEAIVEIARQKDPAPGEAELAEDGRRPLRAPVVVAVVSSPDPDHKTPVWEQELSAGAVCQNLLLAANAAGWAGVWLSEWIAYDREVATLLGLSEQERVAGFVYLGTASATPPERPRPAPAAKIARWRG